MLLGEGSAVDLHLGCEYGHCLSVSAVGVCAGNLALLYAELLGERLLETGGVEGGESGDALGLKASMQHHSEAGEIGGVEDDDYMLYVGAVGLDVLSEVLGYLAVALEEILAGHAFLAGSSA